MRWTIITHTPSLLNAEGKKEESRRRIPQVPPRSVHLSPYQWPFLGPPLFEQRVPGTGGPGAVHAVQIQDGVRTVSATGCGVLERCVSHSMWGMVKEGYTYVSECRNK